MVESTLSLPGSAEQSPAQEPTLRRWNVRHGLLMISTYPMIDLCPWWISFVGCGSMLTLLWLGREQALTRANGVTALRLGIIASLLLFDWHLDQVILGSILFLAMDGLDGYMARRFQEQSLLGAYFDMESDAFAVWVLGASIFLVGGGHVGLMIGALRYSFILLRELRHPDWQGERRSTLGRLTFLLTFLLQLLALVYPNYSSIILAPAFVLVFHSFYLDWQFHCREQSL